MTTPTAKIRITEEGSGSQKSEYQLGNHISLNHKDLEAYCWQRLSETDIDLLVLAASVALADRRVRRRRATGWARQLELDIPVHKPDQWKAASPRIRETLEWLTGDLWEFQFRARRQADAALQLYLPNKSTAPDVAISYSGGLDSFAYANRLRQSNTRALLVTTWHAGLHRVYPAGFERDAVRVPIRLRPGHEREPTYRTRPFLYFVACALAAKMRGASRVVVPEPGQGALGPSLIPFGNEHPYRGTHPGFTFRLSGLLKSLWHQGVPEFVHPNLWMTKAALVREGVVKPKDELWKTTRSCSRDIARTKGLGRSPETRQCGVCGNCLLRRMSLEANQLTDDAYFWQDLASSNLKARRAAVATTKSDQEVATYAVLDIENLARATTADAKTVLEPAIADVALGLGVTRETASKNLARLLSAHRSEWTRFIGKLPASSWLRVVAER